MKRRAVVTALASLSACAAARAERWRPYLETGDVDLPFPYYSFTRQPWRSYLETVPATTLLNGVGICWGAAIPGVKEDDAARVLAGAGFTRARLEIPWGAIDWNETGIVAAHAERTERVLHAFADHGLRPLILLNAHHALPCPMRTTRARVASAAPTGSRSIELQHANDEIHAGDSTIVTFADSAHAGPLITSVEGKRLTLSKPTPTQLAAGAELEIGRLKYLPLYPVGRPELERTLDGWTRYVRYVVKLARDIAGDELDVEIWNELTFGSEFLDVNYYYDPPLFPKGRDFLHAGGSAWELGRRTVDAVREVAPRARVIWGFSNTTAFHTSIADLPAGVGGQSYHPYGVGARCYDRMAEGRGQYNVGGFVPSGCATMPEGWAQTFQQTESFVRLLNPAARRQHPPGVAEFEHYFTEHGVSPRELGITSVDAAWRAKEKFLVRAPLFWLNKGLSGLYVYSAYSPDETQLGMLARDGGESPALRALRRLLDRFAGAEPVSSPRSLDVSLARVDGPGSFYSNDPEGRYVTQEDRVVLLPYAVRAGKTIVAAYVMTEDFPRDLAPQRYRVALEGVAGRGALVEYFDPLRGRTELVRTVSSSDRGLSVELDLTDSPRLLEVTEA
jgi:hypothetical protein